MAEGFGRADGTIKRHTKMIIELIQVDRTSEFVVFIDKKPMRILEMQTSHISLGIGKCFIKLVVAPNKAEEKQNELKENGK